MLREERKRKSNSKLTDYDTLGGAQRTRRPNGFNQQAAALKAAQAARNALAVPMRNGTLHPNATAMYPQAVAQYAYNPMVSLVASPAMMGAATPYDQYYLSMQHHQQQQLTQQQQLWMQAQWYQQQQLQQHQLMQQQQQQHQVMELQKQLAELKSKQAEMEATRGDSSNTTIGTTTTSTTTTVSSGRGGNRRGGKRKSVTFGNVDAVSVTSSEIVDNNNDTNNDLNVAKSDLSDSSDNNLSNETTIETPEPNNNNNNNNDNNDNNTATEIHNDNDPSNDTDGSDIRSDMNSILMSLDNNNTNTTIDSKLKKNKSNPAKELRKRMIAMATNATTLYSTQDTQ